MVWLERLLDWIAEVLPYVGIAAATAVTWGLGHPVLAVGVAIGSIVAAAKLDTADWAGAAVLATLAMGVPYVVAAGLGWALAERAVAEVAALFVTPPAALAFALTALALPVVGLPGALAFAYFVFLP